MVNHLIFDVCKVKWLLFYVFYHLPFMFFPSSFCVLMHVVSIFVPVVVGLCCFSCSFLITLLRFV